MTIDANEAPSSITAVLLEGLDLFEQELLRTADDDWAKHTPCTDWTVDGLTRHVADTADRAGAILRGKPWQASESTAAPRERWATAAAELRATIADTELDGRWPLPSDAPHAKLQFHGCDFTIHRWDLAVARGEEEELPDGWVAFMDEFFHSLPAEVLRRPRAFHDPVAAQASDGPTRRLMAFLGRRPLS